MTDFIPFGTPPGSTGNPKSIIADEFQVGQQIKVATTAQVSGDTNGTPPNPSRVLTDEVFITSPNFGVSLRDIGSSGSDNYYPTISDTYYLDETVGFYPTADQSDVISNQKFSFMGFTDSSVKQTSASGNGTFDWDSTATLATLRALSDADFTLEVNQLRDQIKANIATQFAGGGYNLANLQASGNHFLLDPEFVCFLLFSKARH